MPDKLSIEPIGNKGPNMYIEPRNIIPIRKQTDRKKPDYNNVHEERFASINKSPSNLSTIKRVSQVNF